MIIWVAAVAFFYTLVAQRRRPAYRLYGQSGEVKRVPLLVAVLVFGYIIFWAGIRTGYVDTRAYINSFENMSSNLLDIPKYWNFDNKSPGFDTIEIIFKAIISKDFHMWLMANALVSGILIMVTLRRRSCDFFYSSFLFITTLNFTWLLNGIRQFVVASVLFYLSGLIEQRKTAKFIIAALLCATIHFSALLLIPVYFFVTDKPFGKKILIFTVIIIVASFLVDSWTSIFEEIFEETIFDGYTEQFEGDDGVNPIRVLVAAVPTLIAFIMRKKIDSEAPPFIKMCVNMSIMSVGFYFLGIFTSGILVGRLPIFFELYNLILLPYLIHYCFEKRSVGMVKAASIALYLVFYYLQMSNSYYISDLTGLVGGGLL